MAKMIAFNVRQWHKWVSLFVGIQAMLWLASGLYMVIINLNFIHGDHLVHNMTDTLPANYEPGFGFDDVLSNYPQAELISLETWIGEPFYRIQTASGGVLVDAQTGIQRSPLDRADAIAVAQYHYARSGSARSAQLLVDEAASPSEIQGRKLPLWRIDFEDPGRTSFYVSPDDGSLVTRRHDYWRISLWYGARTPEALAYREEFEQLATDFDNFSWQVALSHLEPHQKWEGHKGWIHEIFQDNFLSAHPDPGRCSFYVCGPPPMLEAVLNLLREAGISEEKIAFDDFGI